MACIISEKKDSNWLLQILQRYQDLQLTLLIRKLHNPERYPARLFQQLIS